MVKDNNKEVTNKVVKGVKGVVREAFLVERLVHHVKDTMRYKKLNHKLSMLKSGMKSILLIEKVIDQFKGLMNLGVNVKQEEEFEEDED